MIWLWFIPFILALSVTLYYGWLPKKPKHAAAPIAKVRVDLPARAPETTITLDYYSWRKAQEDREDLRKQVKTLRTLRIEEAQRRNHDLLKSMRETFTANDFLKRFWAEGEPPTEAWVAVQENPEIVNLYYQVEDYLRERRLLPEEPRYYYGGIDRDDDMDEEDYEPLPPESTVELHHIPVEESDDELKFSPETVRREVAQQHRGEVVEGSGRPVEPRTFPSLSKSEWDRLVDTGDLE